MALRLPLLLLALAAAAPLCAGQQLGGLLLGDWGGQSDAPYTTPAQLNIAAAMRTVGAAINASFVALMGGMRAAGGCGADSRSVCSFFSLQIISFFCGSHLSAEIFE